MSDPKLSHIDDAGRVQMVDVGGKPSTDRRARVQGEITMHPKTVTLITRNQIAKGNVLETARLAGTMAAKRTADLIPLCHPLSLTAIEIDFEISETRIRVQAETRITAQTGVEMEAMMAASVALLTIYDMCKAVDRGMIVSELKLLEKHGGASGSFVR